MIGILSLLRATLTLPGIAGIVLTMGMAVDANVLIYERMREEQNAGRSAIAAIDTGFSRALVDHHRLAHHDADRRARAVLSWLGPDPRLRRHARHRHHHHAVHGLLCSPRLIVAFWVRLARPKAVPL